MTPMPPADLQAFLQEHPAWSLKENKLHREYHFADFSAAFGFMTRVALLAEKADHHPEWLNVYNRLVVDLATHDAGGVTEKDLALARRMESLFRATT
ncbi:MAG: 4a-hydroxytetrahydrobiopterin dehydratase [Thermodesulfobacteriota bacterium]